MAIIKSGESPFQAYARLISVLGDQLISDKWIGVIELVKNSYDADAEKVYVRFLNFNNPEGGKKPIIEIEDDGHGMDLDTILNIWMMPATPNKLNRKKSGDKRFTAKGRVIQGDKGVGRFAVYKLGNIVEVYSKTLKTEEVKLSLDFHDYADDEFTESYHKDLFLHEIFNQWEVNDEPQKILNEKKQGTLIRISDIRNDWKYADLEKLSNAFFRMIPPTLPGVKIVKDFNVDLFWAGSKYSGDFLTFEKMSELAPFYFEGIIDADCNIDATYKHNKSSVSIKFNLLKDENLVIKHDIRKLKLFSERFLVFDENNTLVSKR
ncbi:histidine kinase, partial [Bacteroidales bacterium 6E]